MMRGVMRSLTALNTGFGEADSNLELWGRPKFREGLPRWLSGKELTCSAGDSGSVTGLGKSPGEGNGDPFQYLCLENSMDRGAWWAIVHRDKNLTEQLSLSLNFGEVGRRVG